MKYLQSIAAGLVATFIIGLILFPIVSIIFENFFELHFFGAPPPGEWINDLIIVTTVILWLLVASMAGGIACAIIAKQKEVFAIFLLIVIAFTLTYIITRGNLGGTVIVFSISITSIIGYASGGLLGVRYKAKKLKKSQLAFTNNSSFQPDNSKQ